MPSLIKPFKIAIDLQSLLQKRLSNETSSLKRLKPYKGALGALAVLGEVFDLYLINPYSNINTEEILAWLATSESEKTFRYITNFDEKLAEFYLLKNINITIASDYKIIEFAKPRSIVYWVQEVHTKDIQDEIQKLNSWKELVREITKYSTNEDYDYRYTKDKSPKLID